MIPLRPTAVDTLLLERRNVMATLELKGVVVPASWEVLETPETANGSSLVLVKVLPHGSPVNAGDRVASLEAQPWADQREAAERAVTQAERAVFAGKERAELARQARATALKSAEEDLEHKVATFKAHVQVATELRQRADKLTEQRLQATVDDQRDELAQLEAMYTQDELVDEVEQIVLSRARRGLATAISQLQLNKDQRAHADSLEHPRQTALLERGVSAARHALELSKGWKQALRGQDWRRPHERLGRRARLWSGPERWRLACNSSARRRGRSSTAGCASGRAD
jgi:hypothetical protein